MAVPAGGGGASPPPEGQAASGRPDSHLALAAFLWVAQWCVKMDSMICLVKVVWCGEKQWQPWWQQWHIVFWQGLQWHASSHSTPVQPPAETRY